MNILASTSGDYCHYIVTDPAHTDPDRMLAELRRMFGANTIYWRRFPEVVPEDREFGSSWVHPAHCRARFSTSIHVGITNEPAIVETSADIGHVGSLLYPSVFEPAEDYGVEQAKQLGDDIEGAPV